MAQLDTLAQGMARRAKNYLGSPVGDFYALGANRLMLYPFLTVVLLMECLVYWTIFHGPGFLLAHMAFATIFSLHKAILFTLCLWGTDVLANRLIPSWGAYQKRTVDRQWVIWAVGLAVGMLLLRPLAGSLVVHYAPGVIDYFAARPAPKAVLFKTLVILLPYWGAGVFLALQLARSKNQIMRLSGEVRVEPQETPGLQTPAADGNGKRPRGVLRLGKENGDQAINLADITHVTVEDHYCRVTFHAGNGPKSVLIRLPLKEMMTKLPREHFLQTHRSHVVNLGHVSRLAKEGREHKLVLRHLDVHLPVSRHRFKELEPRLKASISPN